MPHKKNISLHTRKEAYQPKESISRFLPWLEYSPEYACFLLKDGKSVGACLEVKALPVEGRSVTYLESLVQQLHTAIRNSFPQDKECPWIIQVYVQDEPSLQNAFINLRDYIKAPLKENAFTLAHLNIIKAHFDYVSQPGGIFHDSVVTGTVFSGKERRIRMVIYRWIRPSQKNQEPLLAVHALKSVVTHFTKHLKSVGFDVKTVEGKAFYEWLVRWFNPHPSGFENVDALLKACPYPESFPYGWELAEQVFFNTPESFEEGWRFDSVYHKVMAVQSLETSPKAGLLSAELKHLDFTYSLLDKLPLHSTFVMTLVIQDKEETKMYLEQVEKSAIGNDGLAFKIKKKVDEAFTQLADHNEIFPTAMHFYLKASTLDALHAQEEDIATLLMTHGLKVIPHAYELTPIQSYLSFLPMNYDFQFDKRCLYRSRYVYLSDIAKLLPVYGRERGTFHPNFIFFNRGGEPLSFDPLNRQDTKSNSHMLVIGDTGTGKSNLVGSIIASTLAIHNPYFFILEAGGSFDLLSDFFKAHGKQVNKVDFKQAVSLNPFADALTALAQLEKLQEEERQEALSHARQTIEKTLENLKEAEEAVDEADNYRDYFSEMALALRLMITGGQAKEEDRFTRSDSMLIMDALVQAAKMARNANKEQVILEDILLALEQMMDQLDAIKDIDIIKRLKEMHNTIRYFTVDYKARKFFNRPGQPWPLHDVTLVNLNEFIGQDKEKEMYLALAVIGCLNKVMAFAQANQASGRQIVLVIDEAHILLKNPLLVAVLVLIAKMARKLGLWLWLATQHVQDFKDESKKILSMLETWICLTVGGLDQIEDIKRFKTLSEEEESILKNAMKEDGLYSEGVILGKAFTALFRNVPPREYLSLVMTNPEQKYERRQLMQQENMSELEAALYIAKKMKAQTRLKE